MCTSRRYTAISLAASLAAALLAIVASTILKGGSFSTPTAAAIAMLPIPANLVLLWSIVQMVRHMDEMQRRIQLEAAATALVATVALTLTIGWLEKAHALPHINWAFVSIVTLVFYMLGLFVAMRHYR